MHALPQCPLDQKPIYYDNCFANLKFKNGDKYVGEMRDGKRNGRGTLTWASGNIYVGEFKDDNINGQGTHIFTDGRKYVGEWKDNKTNGQGSYTFPDGKIIVGEFKDGNVHGHVNYTFPDGRVYVGEFKNNAANGQGTLTHPDGRREEGIWKDNTFQYAQSAEKTEKERLARQEKERLARKEKQRAEERRKKEKQQAEEKRKAEALLAAQKKAEEADKLIAVGSGSSFAVNTEGTFISNQHVIDGCSKIELIKSGKPLVASVVASDERNDLALIQVSDPLDQEVFYRLSDEPIKVMDNVYVGGYPFGNLLGKNVKVTRGIISSMAGVNDDVSQLMIDAAIQPGNSGGPIFLTNGKLAAVTVASLDSLTILKSVDALPQNTNFGIKLSVLREFLSANNVTIPKQSLFTRDFERDELVNEAILQVICYARKGDVQKLKQRKVLFDALMKE